jgi:hypothetical protein
MRASQAVVHINKIAAAKRQLEAAIRMFFAKEDELAVHTVASAAFRVLRDIHFRRRGKTLLSGLQGAGLFYVAKRHSEGKTPEEEIPFLKSSGLLPLIESIAREMKEQGENFNRDQIDVTVSRHEEQAAWPSKIANFLKHADHDPDSHIALDQVENEKTFDERLRRVYGSDANVIARNRYFRRVLAHKEQPRRRSPWCRQNSRGPIERNSKGALASSMYRVD